jgi:hypothetical protein
VARLGFVATEQRADYAEHPVCARPIPGDWSLLVAKGCEHRIVAEDQLAALSGDCDVVACTLEEHVIFSSCEWWSRGRREWRVAHDAQKTIDHLETSGALPADFAEMRARTAEQQVAEDGQDGQDAEVDLFFEVPLALAQARVGFKHDELNGFETDGTFQVLADASATSSGRSERPWWMFWR